VFASAANNPRSEAIARILVIEDEPSVARFVGRALSGHGLGVEVALGGERGLDLACERDYDLVLLDLRMPDVNGLVVLRQLLRWRPEQRVLVLSAAADVETRVRCLEQGAADFLAKPFELAELIARVDARLRRVAPAGDSERELRVGRLALNVARRTVDAGDGPVTLPERECALLRHLMLRARTPCTRGQLLAAIWGTTFDPGTNVVDVYVHRLREKLPPNAIATIRGVGYVLDG
jgi:DNA-binding response OmpR family regulator